MNIIKNSSSVQTAWISAVFTTVLAIIAAFSFGITTEITLETESTTTYTTYNWPLILSCAIGSIYALICAQLFSELNALLRRPNESQFDSVAAELVENKHPIRDLDTPNELISKFSDDSLPEQISVVDQDLTKPNKQDWEKVIPDVAVDDEISVTPLRVAIAGSSISWGLGFLGEHSFVGAVEDQLRNKKATTLHADVIAPFAKQIRQNNFYKGALRRIEEIDAAVEFDLFGDELTINLLKERGNVGAALIDLYVDGSLYDTFSTVNTLPAGRRSKGFIGDGIKAEFDLEEPFTYEHLIKIDGKLKHGGINTQPSGASIPHSWDYMIIRHYNATLECVTHAIWFKSAPIGRIECDYKYGETIAYMKGSVGNVARSIDSVLESSFGDGLISEDTTVSTPMSSGLGFRESDPRACVTYIFGESKVRHFRLVISALARGGSGTPCLNLNFVTNRMHHIMNAGIGGWSASLMLNSPVLINRIDRVAEYSPDICLFESCTNDDWLTHVSKGYVTRTGVTNAQLKADESSNYFNRIEGLSDNKTVQDDRLPIIDISANSVTIETNNATITAIRGDAVIIGAFHGDHRRVAVRIIESYKDGVITFKKAISATEFAQARTLKNLVGEWVLLKSAPDWLNQVKQCIEIITHSNPECEIRLATCGIPNYNHRRLFGYREWGKELAKSRGWKFIDFYGASLRYQYNQPLDSRLYIGAEQGIKSTGASQYILYKSNGVRPSNRLIHNIRVFVNGIERTNIGCHIEGGYAFTWGARTIDPTLENDGLYVRPYILKFTFRRPPRGAAIEVFYSSRRWSSDDTHPGRPEHELSGVSIFGATAAAIF